eukprot:Seg976.6 transcript_id=Seg976.6/GoldUCD/mRNA.D3Y31 product="Chaperone protein DnaJ" protein_id=Seg976.6/GoldUCD/D3Y31
MLTRCYLFIMLRIFVPGHKHGLRCSNANFYNNAQLFPQGQRFQSRNATNRYTTDYYGALRVSSKATPSQIKTAYYKLSLIYHPDKNNGTAESQAKFATISEAYHVLSDSTRRKNYDRALVKDVSHQRFDPEVLRKHRNSNLEYRDSFDEWTRAHYGSEFQRSQKIFKKKLAFIRKMKEIENQKLWSKKFIPTTTLVVIFCVLVSSFRY